MTTTATRYLGLYPARIVSAADPQKKGRAQLQVPEVLGTTKTGWAPAVLGISQPVAGLPVYASFINGDPSAPVWWGSIAGTLVLTPTAGQTGLTILDGGGPKIVNVIIVVDAGGAPIWWVNNAGGMGTTDMISTTRDVRVEPANVLDIYGNHRQNGMVTTAQAGPPGNMMSWANSLQEVYESSRAGTVGDWISAFGPPPTLVQTDAPTPRGFAVQVTAPGTSLSAVTGTGAFAYPISGTTTYSTIIHAKAVALARDAAAGLQWFAGDGTFISESLGTPTGTSTSAWTMLLSGELTPPGGAALAAPTVRYATTAAGEQHLICKAGMYPFNNTVWAPPFVAQPWSVYGEARPGDRWNRWDTPAVAGQRDYICVTGGLPHAQAWLSTN